ncbi:saxitoxin and tetrodotoxin-binding protein 1 isoform X2 [Gadus morhua]|uniref:saxitoxin and tetrodotoxin-binding protein 1 isoform X2 n=1 Tax=Gadus morhua TaxID=8049 RepID=UPI0011B7EBB6|nr:saxitoxin and tetrodotoxin-binding protein 1-like isoform X2 [Gadus morhua]
MAAVFAVLLLGLLAPATAAADPAAAATAAATVPPASSCDDVITPLRRDQADKALGSWVLVGVVTDRKTGLPLHASSFMELSLSEDNSSFTYIERSGLGNEPCNRFRIMGNITDDANLTLRLHTLVSELGGPRECFGQITLFQSCPSCPEDRLTFNYRGVYDPTDSNSTAVQFVMNYRREGEHQDLEALKEVPLSTRQQAVCLNMTEITGEYSYDGVTELCLRKKPTTEDLFSAPR